MRLQWSYDKLVVWGEETSTMNLLMIIKDLKPHEKAMGPGSCVE
jgi:hypothetical protein